MPRIRPETRDARRRAFVDAGWRCVAATGFHRLTVDDVCREAGASKGSFYSHFNEKQELLVALLDDDAAGVEEVIEDAGDGADHATDRIRRFLRSLMALGDDPARVRVRADLWAEAMSDETLRSHMGDAIRRRRAMLAALLADAVAAGELRDVPSNATAAVLLALADGLVLHAEVDPGGFRWVNVRRAVSALLDGLEVA